MKVRPDSKLITLIGEDALVRLAEAFGGIRLYIPPTIDADHVIARTIGLPASCILAKHLGGAATIKVPLAREARARQYRAAGRSNAQIARALGITENGVERLFQRMPACPAKGTG